MRGARRGDNRRHFFNADRSWYKDFPIVDDRNYEAILRGQGRCDAGHQFGLELGKSQAEGGPNTINLTDITGVQTSLQEQHIAATAQHRFNRLILDLTG